MGGQNGCRELATCPRSSSKLEAELGIGPGLPGLRVRCKPTAVEFSRKWSLSWPGWGLDRSSVKVERVLCRTSKGLAVEKPAPVRSPSSGEGLREDTCEKGRAKLNFVAARLWTVLIAWLKKVHPLGSHGKPEMIFEYQSS